MDPLSIRAAARTRTRKDEAEREKKKRKPAIVIGPIDDVLPFIGRRNPLTRSSTSYKSGMLIRTPADGFRPRVSLYDSEAEEAVSIAAVLHPNVYSVECQPLTIPLPGGNGKPKSHTFDLRIVFVDGTVKLIYVRAQVSLNRSESVSRIAEIVRCTPADAADQIVVISDIQFSRVYRDNNRRILICHQMPNAEADAVVVERMNRHETSVRLEQIVQESGLEPSVAWQAIMRMIGAGQIGADRDVVIDYPARIWRAVA